MRRAVLAGVMGEVDWPDQYSGKLSGEVELLILIESKYRTLRVKHNGDAHLVACLPIK